MNISTRAGNDISLQISAMGIADISTSNFSKESTLFHIKNDSDIQQELTVKLADSDEWVTTTFDIGWNPEIIVEIQMNASISSGQIKWGI